ncbi:hypothetical protein QF042_004715 [Pedobacter sp. W3I1]|nr:hypothetical protein [Pedobacter sp. W3I1]
MKTLIHRSVSAQNGKQIILPIEYMIKANLKVCEFTDLGLVIETTETLPQFFMAVTKGGKSFIAFRMTNPQNWTSFPRRRES